MEESTELEYLRWFRMNADFGPAHGDVVAWLDQRFEKATGKRVPMDWASDRDEDEDEES